MTKQKYSLAAATTRLQQEFGINYPLYTALVIGFTRERFAPLS